MMIDFFKSYGTKEKILYVFVGFLPFVLFLNNNNLPQLEAEEIKIIFFSQLILFFIIVFFGLLLFMFLFKNYYKNINSDDFLLILFVLYYFSFFYNESLTKNLHNIIINGYYFSAFIFFIIIVTIFSILLKFINSNYKSKNIFYLFISIFLIINYTFFFYNLTHHLYKKTTYKNLNTQNASDSIVNLKSKKDKNIDIYFIVLDGMMSLDNAENLQIINKEIALSNLKKIGGTVSKNSFTNYTTTHLSLTSIFEMDYFISEGKDQYYDMRKIFPKILKIESTPLIKILKNIDREMYWIGNEWAYCKSNKNIKCLFFNNTKIYITLNKFYKNNPLIHFINFAKDYLLFNDNYYLNSFDFYFRTKNTLKKINSNLSEKNKFFFVHVYKPHPPFIFDSDCQILKNEIKNKFEGYKNNYKCTFERIPNFIDEINKHDKKEKLFIFIGDHGWFENQKDILILSFKNSCSLNTFLPKSTINTIRFALNCSDNIEIPYIKDKHIHAEYVYKENGIFGNFTEK